MKKLKILVVDDHKMIRDGIRSMLELYKKRYAFSIHIAESGEDAVVKAKKGNYDLIIMDYQLPQMSGVEATREILKQKPLSRILALSNYDEQGNITNMLKAGAKGFVLKNIGPDELILAIETILKGKNYYSNDIAIKLIRINNAPSKSKKQKPGDSKMVKEDPEVYVSGEIEYEALSDRELEILRLIVAECTNQEIAEALSLSKRTVDKHRQRMHDKLRVTNTVGLLKRAMELKLID